MELVNKTLKAVVDGVEKNISPATRSDNVYLASDQEKTIEEGLISVYTHSKSGTTHALTGTGNNIKFVADAPFNDGDTITVNGETVSAQTQDGEPLQSGAWASGNTVVCWLNGTILNFKGGGGKVTVSGLTADAVKQGTTVTVQQGSKTIAEVAGTLVPFGTNRLVSFYHGRWLGDRSYAIWIFARVNGSMNAGYSYRDYSDSWACDFNGTVKVSLAGTNQCRINGSARTGTFSVKVGDVVSWHGNYEGSNYLIQMS